MRTFLPFTLGAMLVLATYVHCHTGILAQAGIVKRGGGSSGGGSSDEQQWLHVIAIRHGQTAASQKQQVQGHLDGPDEELTREGHKQAVLVADTLKRQKVGVNEIISCVQQRAQQTAQHIRDKYEHARYRTNPDLRGTGMGDAEGKKYGPRDFEGNWRASPKYRHAESEQAYISRIKKALREVLSIGHAGPSSHSGLASGPYIMVIVGHAHPHRDFLRILKEEGKATVAPNVNVKAVPSDAAISHFSVKDPMSLGGDWEKAAPGQIHIHSHAVPPGEVIGYKTGGASVATFADSVCQRPCRGMGFPQPLIRLQRTQSRLSLFSSSPRSDRSTILSFSHHYHPRHKSGSAGARHKSLLIL